MEDLTQRQVDILRVIIKEYSESGSAVGSEILEKKYKLGVSPATIRNEMVELAKKGYLKKAHFSSGRIPSAKGFRFFIKHLMKQKEMSTTDEVSYKNSIWDERSEAHRLLSQATKVLSQKTGLLSLITTNYGDLYYAGVGNLLSEPEFFDLNLSRSLFGRLDEVPFWFRILNDFDRIEEDVMCMLGEEDFHDSAFDSCASVWGEFEGAKIKGMIGVVGPKRMYYEEVIPQIKYFSNLIEEIIKEQKL
ncbi:MAG: Transcriptional regulator of heat shock protein [Candidatus Roizmanbacteria bacterium GW2011_GWA2_35_8]|uniref:Transcriptional regulator of heat shock protein n=1 Tax=Candidatus Roizmanbacteria bacterium GW2011_GWA2_35_8 TaxID=1618479 RepID=A0A0G0CYV0_9BACT|nr:MAG: Transcriptional regulator of heat shock protein [Candidatus Roizmanbacteria bacterium GW2011_GWA2_35_8]